MATIFAPRTTTPSSVSLTRCTNTSLTSWISLLRSTGGLTSVWFMKKTFSCDSEYQRLALSANGA